MTIPQTAPLAKTEKAPPGKHGELWPSSGSVIPMPQPIRYTVIKSTSPIAKRFGAKDGKPVKLSSDAVLYRGVATRFSLKGDAVAMANQLAADLDALGVDEVVVCAPPPSGQNTWLIVTEAEVASTPGAISRTRKNFPAPAGPALFGLDFDTKDYPSHVLGQLMELGPGNLSDALAEAFPAFGDAASVTRPSMSVGVRHRDTGQATSLNAGLHRYFFVSQGDLIAEFAKILADRLMLNGWLWGVVSRSGNILFRTLIDIAASSDPSRLWYEGQSILVDPALEHVPDARKAKVREGGFLDLSSMTPLTVEERTKLETMKDEWRERLADEAARARFAHSETVRARVPSVPRATFEADYRRAVDDQVLQGDFPIALDDGTSTTPREILANKAKFHRKTCGDPIEPEYGGGRNKAVIFTDGPSVRIESVAHGGITYQVALSVEDVFEAIEEDDKEGDSRAEPQDPFGYGDTTAVLAMPRGVLPDILDRFARDTSERIGTPAAYPAVAGLATISGAIGSKLRIQPKEHDTSWTEPAFLWLAIVEEPGGKKSPIIRAATAPLMKVNADKVAEGERRYAEWLEVKRLANKSKEPVPPEPKFGRSIVDGFTMEALAGVLADNPGGVLVVQDELTGLLGSFDAYKANKGSDRPMMLRLFDGSEASVDRVGRRHTRVPCWGASLLGGIQPRKISELASNMDADGLLQRFLLIFGDGRKYPSVDRAPDAEAVAAYSGLVETLARAERLWTQPVRLSQEALAIWRPLAKRIETLADIGGLSEAWRGHLGKLPGMSARVLLIYHVLDCWQPGFARGDIEGLANIDTVPVTAATARGAVRLVEWLLANSLRFYQECIGAGEAGEDARWIAGHILANGVKDRVTRHDIGQARKELRDKPERVARAMAYLAQIGWVIPDMENRVDSRLGATWWTICPAVHDGRFASHAEVEQAKRRHAQAAIRAAGQERARIMEANHGDG